jgi:hypothetical protein
MYYIYRGITTRRGSHERKNLKGGPVMKYTSLAICSLGIWVFLSAFVHGSWVGIVFGIIAALLALAGAFTKSES